MYAIINDKGKIIAFHNKRKIVELYLDSVEDNNNLSIVEINNELDSSLEDLHLVRYQNTYIQSGYLIYINLASDNIIEDEEYAKEILLRTIEIQNLTDKENKKLIKAIEVLDKIIHKDKKYTPSLNELKSIKDHYDYYLLNKQIMM